MRISDWSSDVCSSDLDDALDPARLGCLHLRRIEKASQDACDLLDLALLAADEMADACHYDFARVNVVRGGGHGKLAQWRSAHDAQMCKRCPLFGAASAAYSNCPTVMAEQIGRAHV